MAKIALAQFQSVVKDVEANNSKMVRMIKDAADENADIIVFPELFTTGYNMDLIKDEIYNLAQDEKGSTITLAKKSAKDNNIYVIIPIAMKKDDELFNSSVLIDRNGDIVNIYDKNHLWDKEQGYFSYGNHDYRVHETDFGKIGVIVCYDVDFPEPMRKLALQGAQLVFVSAAWATSHRNLWDIFLPARALENTIYVAGVNRTGIEGDVHFFGDSKVFDPTGELIARANEDSEEILYCDIDFDKIQDIRIGFPYLDDRRPEGY